ncbi:secreted ookinete adhesive protein, putative [Plasmodium gallinaceum]|uniref:Secreted ookinete adhesive protein, putative n=1 Tax=Plasmodium gallinaceum TaxID=5849 RepID=A0A1J1GSU2_PLAGA|nr:secreted ookinete adhesive protein, putative [Plasmodium gallinaceum]CRG95563.1 secreted ookinete adhesive protein, putative [Plasmodium gallinaceum]
MKKIFIIFVSLFCAFIYGKGVRNISRKSSVAHPHNQHKVKNVSALEIFSREKTEKDCIKCLPENFCECECNCKNKTGFSMKYRNASLGSNSKRKSMNVNKKISRSRKCNDLPIEDNSGSGAGTEGSGTEGSGTEGSETEGSGTEGSETEGSETEGSGTEGSGTEGSGTEGSGTEGSENGATECYSSCHTETGVQTEECNCSCSC